MPIPRGRQGRAGDERIRQGIVIFTVRIDVAEELARLSS